MSFLKHIQTKPHHWKKKFSIIVATTITAIVFLLWLGITLPKTLSRLDSSKDESTKIIAEIKEPLKVFGYKLSDVVTDGKVLYNSFLNRKEELKRDSLTASTTSSSTDLVQ